MGRVNAIACAMLAALLCAAAPVNAQQGYPNKRITMYSPYPPSSVAYILARLLGDELQKRFGQTVVVESKPGAGGIVALQALQLAPADGYTLVHIATSNTASPVFAKSPPGLDPEKDFLTVVSESYSPYFLIMSGSVPATNLTELIAYAKANPGKLNLAMHNNTWSHLNSLDFMQKFSVQMTMVPYAGGATAVQAMLAGDAHVYVAGGLFGMADHIKSGKLRAIATLDEKRFPLNPEIPTALAQTGVNLSSLSYLAIQVRTGTPQSVIDRIGAMVKEVYADPAVAEQVRKLAFEPNVLTQQEAARVFTRSFAQAREIARIAKLPAP
jgi:tripartite-type tricarboxylate transporter receptor subunit TctC